jgi:hypothetical protein
VVDGRHVRPFRVALDDVRRAVRAPAAGDHVAGDARVGHARVCYRDVANATNRLTLLAAILPSGVTATHTVFTARRVLPRDDDWVLVALLNSLVANFLVRLQVTTHVTTTLMARLPVPRPQTGSADARALAALARTLGRAGSIDEAPDAYGRLNALTARLYGLSSTQYRHVIDAFPLLGPALAEACLEAWSRAAVSAQSSR